jgi:hypothetical protein
MPPEVAEDRLTGGLLAQAVQVSEETAQIQPLLVATLLPQTEVLVVAAMVVPQPGVMVHPAL